MAVILLSLLRSSVALPLLARSEAGDAGNWTEAEARGAAAETAIRRIEQLRRGLGDGYGEIPEEAHAAIRSHPQELRKLLGLYRRRLRDTNVMEVEVEETEVAQVAAHWLQTEALRAELEEIHRLHGAGHLSDEVHEKLVREVGLREKVLTSE